MFEFIKKLFSEEIEKKELSLKEFEPWFENLAKEKMQKASEIIAEFNAKLEKNISESKNKIEHLDKSELKNQKIPERAKQLLYGNKQAYINKIRHFLEDVTIPKDINSAKEALEKFESNLDILTKSTQKSYMILQEFLANESRDVAVTVNEIRNSLKELNEKLKKENIELLNEIKEELLKIKNTDKQKKEMKNSIEEKKNRESNIIKEIEEVEKEIGRLEKSSEFKSMKSSIEKKKKIEEKINALEKSIHHIFSILEKSLKKFQRMTLDENLVKDYLEKPINALFRDYEFKLIDVLQSMKNAILKDNLQLKDKKKDRTVEIIEKTTREYLSKFRKDYENLKEELRKIEEKISGIKVGEQIENIKGKKDFFEKTIEKTRNELEDLKKQLKNIDINRIIERISEKAGKITGMDMKIK